jgi:hypothetical protein
VNGTGYTYYPRGIEDMTAPCDTPIKQQITLPSGALYTVYKASSAWGAQENRAMIREADRKRGAWPR